MSYLDNFQYFDAPLKLFPTSEILARNNAITLFSSWAQGLTPFISNKVSLVKYLGNPALDANKRIPAGCPFAFYSSRDIVRSFSVGAAGLIGGIAPLLSNSGIKPTTLEETIEPYNAQEPIYYYTHSKLKDYIPNYSNVKQLIKTACVLGYGSDSTSYYPQTSLFAGNMAKNLVRISYTPSSEHLKDVNFSDVLDVENMGNWIVITGFSLYDKKTDYPRINVPYVFPTIFYNASATYFIGKWALANPANFTREFLRGLTLALPFNPLYNNDIYNTYLSPYADRFSSYNNTFGNILGDVYIAQYWYGSGRYQELHSPLGDRLPPLKSDGYKNAMTVIGWGNAKPKVDISNENFYVGGEGAYFADRLGIRKDVNDSGTTWVFSAPILIFKSTEDFENLCRDFGFVATSKLNDALNLPIDFFPDTGGGTVPDGGASSGFPTNPIPNVPNYPDNTTDIIPQTAPTVSALSSAGVYALNVTQSKSFLQWLMTDDFTQNISNLFNDKLSAVGDLRILPFDIAAHDPIHAVYSDTLTVGNVSGNIPNYRVIDNYNTWISGGEYTYTAYYGDFNDYDKCSYALFIPYAGIIELNAGDVVNKTLKLSYAVDLLTGNATAVIYSNGVIIKTTSATMGISVPITSTNNNQRQLNNALTALSVGNNVLGGVVSSVASGSPTPVLNALRGGLMQGITNDMANPLITQHTGSFGNGTGLSLPQTAFLIITRQVIAMPTDYKKIVGIPATYRGKISEFVGSGFVSISADKIDISCTQSEREEILSALSRGIYL